MYSIDDFCPSAILWCYSGFAPKKLYTTSSPLSICLCAHITSTEKCMTDYGIPYYSIGISSIHAFGVCSMVQPIQFRCLTYQCQSYTHVVFQPVKSRWQCSWVNSTAGWISLASRRDTLTIVSITIDWHRNKYFSTWFFIFIPRIKNIYLFWGLHPVKWLHLTVISEATRRTLQIEVTIKHTWGVSLAND